MNIKRTIIEALKEGPKSLQELYEVVEAKQHTIRARLNEGVGKNFSRVGRGWYALFNDETGGSALIIQGDAWKILPTLEDDSFDAIITDSVVFERKIIHHSYLTSFMRNQSIKLIIGIIVHVEISFGEFGGIRKCCISFTSCIGV